MTRKSSIKKHSALRLVWRRWILPLLGAVILIAFLNAGLGFWALKRIERKAGTPIRGIFLPHLLQPSFTLRNAKLVWQGRFEVLSGVIRVRYNPLSVVGGGKFRIQVTGSDLDVRFLKETTFSGLHPSEIQIERITADLAFLRGKPPEIFSLEIHSPELEFHFSEKSRNSFKAMNLRTEN